MSIYLKIATAPSSAYLNAWYRAAQAAFMGVFLWWDETPPQKHFTPLDLQVTNV